MHCTSHLRTIPYSDLIIAISAHIWPYVISRHFSYKKRPRTYKYVVHSHRYRNVNKTKSLTGIATAARQARQWACCACCTQICTYVHITLLRLLQMEEYKKAFVCMYLWWVRITKDTLTNNQIYLFGWS